MEEVTAGLGPASRTLHMAARAGGRAWLSHLFQRFMDDGLDGGVAAAAFGAAAKAAIDSPGRARARLSLDGGADILIGKDIAGADDHNGTWMRIKSVDLSLPPLSKKG